MTLTAAGFQEPPRFAQPCHLSDPERQFERQSHCLEAAADPMCPSNASVTPFNTRRTCASRLVTGTDPGPPLTRKQEGLRREENPGELVRYAAWMSPPATLVMWFQLRSPELAEDFERLMTEDRDNVRGSLDTMSDWRLMRPADVPGQSIGQADYVLIAEIAEVERWEQQATEHVQRLADDLAHLVSNRGMLVVRPVS